MKKCNSCYKIKAINLFHKHKGCKNGVRPDCKACYRKKNISIYKRDKRRYYDTMYKKLYNITHDEYDDLLFMQDYKCAICGTNKATPNNKKRFNVDHDHKTGIVRGLLCINCNKGLGHFKDNKNVLENAINYLD